jgi:hypothetical protein
MRLFDRIIRWLDQQWWPLPTKMYEPPKVLRPEPQKWGKKVF